MSTNKYWLGTGCLGGKVFYGQEIPEGMLTKERTESFEKKGLIGEKIAPINKIKNEHSEKIEKLEAENKALKEKIEKLEAKKTSKDDVKKDNKGK